MFDEKYEHAYDDIINLPYPNADTGVGCGLKHPRMAAETRAAQFSPFAALTGLDDTMEKTAKAAEEKILFEEKGIDIEDI